MTVVNSAAAGEAANNDAQYIDLVMSVYNLIEYMIIMERHQEFYGNIVEMFRL